MAPSETTSAATLTREIRALGATFDADVLAATRAAYRPHLDLSEAAEERADVAYGPHPRHKLDVYLPAGAPSAVVVFVHGGGFVAGDKNGDGVFYRNVGRWLARHGFAAVLPNYRLAPGDAWPAGAVDVQAALQWVEQNSQTFGAAPRVLWGQSAGASHVASWLFDAAARGGDATPVAAVMLMSGFFVAEAPLPAGPRAYFGEDPSLYVQRSPLTHVALLEVALWLGVAELDPGWIAQQSYAMACAVTLANGRSPDFHFFRGHNHVSTVQSLGSPQQDCADELLRFLRGVTAGQAESSPVDRPPSR
jgi:dienelactone hydrolase